MEIIKAQSKKENKLKVNIFTEFGQSFWGEYDKQTLAAEIQGTKWDEITVNLSSYGGWVYEGINVHDMLKAFSNKVIINYIGTNASASTIVGASGDEVNMTESGSLLFHLPEGGVQCTGTEPNLKKAQEELRRITDQMIEIYQKKTGKSYDELYALLENETTLYAKEAKEWGFVDNIVPANKIAALVKKEEIEKSIHEKTNKIADDINDAQKTNNYKMEEVLNFLNLKDESKILDSIRKMKEDIDGYKNLIDTLKSEKQELETKIVEDKIDQLIQDNTNLLSADEVEHVKSLARLDFDVVKSMLESRKPIVNIDTTNLMKSDDDKPVTNSKSVPKDEMFEGKENWTYFDYFKNEPKTLETIESKYPEYFKSLTEAHLTSTKGRITATVEEKK